MQEEKIYIPVHIAKPQNSIPTPPDQIQARKKAAVRQVIFGITLAALGIYSAILTSDGTAAFFIVPLGIGSIFKRY